MLDKLHREAVKRALVQTRDKALDNQTCFEIETTELGDDSRIEVSAREAGVRGFCQTPLLLCRKYVGQKLFYDLIGLDAVCFGVEVGDQTVP